MNPMTNVYGEELEVLTASGLASGMLFVGRMLARNAGRGAHSEGRDDFQAQSAWSLCGALHRFMFDAVSTQKVVHSVTHLQLPTGLGFLMFAQSAGKWQHRVVLPLVGEDVRSFLRSAHKEPVRFSLADGARRMALVYEGSELSKVLPDESGVLDLPQAVQPLLNDIIRISTLALLPGSFPTLGQHTSLTCVSSIYPPELLAAMEKKPSHLLG